MINSRSIDALHPKVKDLAEKFIANCLAQGWEVLIYCTYRDAEAQNELYAQGRTKPGKIVTNAKGGQSMHQYRVAFDWVPMLHGKPQWSNDEAYLKCAEIGEALGFEWAGRWKSFKETAHLQYTDGLTLHDFQQGKSI